MKRTVDLTTFKKAFYGYERGDNFSNEGLEALFNYMGKVEDEAGYEMELDVVELCSMFAEYEASDFLYEFIMHGEDNGINFLIDKDGKIENDNIDIKMLKNYLSYVGILIPVSETRFIIQQF